jgi:hypothetical protein
MASASRIERSAPVKTVNRIRRAGSSSTQSGVTIIEMMIATIVLTIGLVSLAQLFIWATMNNSFVVRTSGGLNDAQRLIEYYKYIAATNVNGVAATTITSSSFNEGTGQCPAFVALPGYQSSLSDYKEYVWVYDSTGTRIGAASPANPDGVPTANLIAPTKYTRLIYVRLIPKTPDPRVNRQIDMSAIIGSPLKPT